MTQKTTQDWNNYWQGRSAKDHGDALVGVGVEHNSVLETYWLSFFKDCEPNDSVVDLACGAGSVLKHAHNLGFRSLTGIDVAEDAIKVMTANFPEAKGIVSSIDKLPKTVPSYDVVVSQFGFEYAGTFEQILSSIREMCRICTQGGKISFISHIKDGAIERDCSKSLNQIEIIQKSGFLEMNERIFKELFRLLNMDPRPNSEAFYKAVAPLNSTAEPVMDLIRSTQNQSNDFTRFTYHMMESSHRLITNFERYTLEDCVDWVKRSRMEIDAYKGRMESMLSATLSKDNMLSIKNLLSEHNFKIKNIDTINFRKTDLPAAWVLSAQHSEDFS